MNVRRYKACQTITYRNGFKKILADYKGQVEFDETKIPVFEADNDDFTLTLYNLNYVINVNNTQCDTRNGTQGGAQDKLQKQIFDMIEENLQISTSEIATRLGVGVRTVKRRIKQMILSILVDTFISKISFPMQPGPEIGSISDA